MSQWWKEEKNVNSYINMVAGSEGILYLDDFLAVLPEKARVLELGMGPGKDLDILSSHYIITGSDLSPYFIDLYRERHPEADLVLLDAVSLEMPESHAGIVFDGITSNKVLVHLNPEELRQSLNRQLQLVGPGGILCHSLWTGDGDENFDGLYFHYWNSKTLVDVIPEDCEIVSMGTFQEEEKNDSLLLILKRRV